MRFRVRQLDLILTVAVSLVVGVLGVFDVVGTAVIGGATLTTLGLLALSSLNGRAAVNSLTRTVTELGRHVGDQASVDRLLSPSTPGTDLDLTEADDIRMVGVTLARTVRNHYAVLEERLAAGAHVRIALIAPSAATVAEAARRSTVGDRPEIFEHRLRPTLDLLDSLAAGPGRLEIRLLDFVPAFGLVATDPSRADGRLRVDIYSHRCGLPEATLPLHADRDPHWFRHFADEFDLVWAAGRRYGHQLAGR